MATLNNAINAQNMTFGDRTITTSDNYLTIPNGINLSNSVIAEILNLEFNSSVVGGQLVLSAMATNHLQLTNPYAVTPPPPGDVYDTYCFPIGGTGTAGQVLSLTTTSDSSTAQVVNWTTPSGVYNWSSVTTTTTLVPGKAYIATGGSTVNFNFPAFGSCNVGDSYIITSGNSNGWILNVSSGQTVYVTQATGATQTPTTSITPTLVGVGVTTQGCTMAITCVASNLTSAATFIVTSYTGLLVVT